MIEILKRISNAGNAIWYRGLYYGWLALTTPARNWERYDEFVGRWR